MAPRALTYCLAQFMGSHQSVREACLTYTAQKRGMGEEINIVEMLERLEALVRRELQHPNPELTQAFWRSQYGYVRAMLKEIRKGSLQRTPEPLRRPNKYQVVGG